VLAGGSGGVVPSFPEPLTPNPESRVLTVNENDFAGRGDGVASPCSADLQVGTFRVCGTTFDLIGIAALARNSWGVGVQFEAALVDQVLDDGLGGGGRKSFVSFRQSCANENTVAGESDWTLRHRLRVAAFTEGSSG